MARRGPKPAPTRLKILRGTRADRVNTSEPQPRDGRPSCPKWLDAEGKAEWKRILDELEPMAVVTRVDAAALAIYCNAFSLMRQCNEDIAEKGLTIPTVTSEKLNPTLSMARGLKALCLQILTEFGATPSSRARLEVKAEAVDQLGEFIARGKKKG